MPSNKFDICLSLRSVFVVRCLSAARGILNNSDSASEDRGGEWKTANSLLLGSIVAA